MNELDLTAPSILSLFDTTKAQRLSFADKVAEAIDEGRIDPLKLKIQLKAMEDIITRISDNERIKDAIETEAAKYGKGSHDFHNATFQIKSTAGHYKFVGTDEEKALINKALRDGCHVVTNDGEAFTVNPKEYSPGGEALFVTLK